MKQQIMQSIVEKPFSTDLTMFRSQIILLGVAPFLFLTTTESRTTLSPRVEHTRIDADWEKDKLEVLSDMVETILKHTGSDIRIIASQNVHNDDGSFKEIKTIELTIPRKFHKMHWRPTETEEYLERLKMSEDEELDDIFMKMQTDFRTMYETEDIEKEAAYQKLYEDGDTEMEIYVNRNDAFYQDDEGMGYFLRDNIHGDNKEKLEEEFKKRFQDRSNTTLLSVLVWDEGDKFISEESNVEPKLLAYVDKASDTASEDMMDTAVEALSKLALNSPDRVAKELSAAMSNEHPDYFWFVTKGHEEQPSNAKHDVFIKMTYYNVRMGEGIMQYTLYGLKK